MIHCQHHHHQCMVRTICNEHFQIVTCISNVYAGLWAESTLMLEQPPVKCSTPCQDGFAGHVDQSILLSPCARPRISNFSGTPDAVTIYGMSVIAAQV